MADDTSTTAVSSAESQSFQVPSSDWRIDALAQAERLEAELARAPADAPPQAVDKARELITRARRIAAGEPHVGSVRDWLFGLSVESAWRWLQQAQEELLLVRPEEELRGELPRWRKLAALQADPATEKTLTDWQTTTLPIDPHLVRPILASTHFQPIRPTWRSVGYATVSWLGRRSLPC